MLIPVSTVQTVIASEPELDGPMPDFLWLSINGNRKHTELFIRAAIKAAKEGIQERLLAAVNEGTKGKVQ